MSDLKMSDLKLQISEKINNDSDYIILKPILLHPETETWLTHCPSCKITLKSYS